MVLVLDVRTQNSVHNCGPVRKRQVQREAHDVVVLQDGRERRVAVRGRDCGPARTRARGGARVVRIQDDVRRLRQGRGERVVLEVAQQLLQNARAPGSGEKKRRSRPFTSRDVLHFLLDIPGSQSLFVTPGVVFAPLL